MNALASLATAALFFAMGTPKAQAQPAPPNISSTNAQVIYGVTGTVFGTNLYVPVQPNGPTNDPFTNEYSVWYVWTAPISGEFDFNTRTSTTTNTNGAPLDTVMAIYSVKGGTTNFAWTNLTLVGTNDDDSNTNWGVTSRVSFAATLGNVYLIQVDGSPKGSPGTNAQGYITLNWLPSLQGGGFGFSATYFAAGSLDDYIFNNDSAGSISPSIYGHTGGSANVRVTITRSGGYTGKCSLTFLMTNNMYSNYYQYRYMITNIYQTNLNTNTGITTFSNVLVTNVAIIDEFQDDYYGNMAVLTRDRLITYAETNSTSGGDLFNQNFIRVGNSVVVNPTPIEDPLGGYGLPNFFTNFVFPRSSTNVGGPVTNSDGTLSTFVTNIYTIQTNWGTNMPAAFNQVHYNYSGPITVTFDDFQMSQDIYVQVDPILTQYDANISPLDTPAPGPEDDVWFPAFAGESNLLSSTVWRYYDPTNNYEGLNESVTMTISNVVMDPNENGDILPPTIVQSNADLNILSYWGPPAGISGTAFGTNTVQNGTLQQYSFEYTNTFGYNNCEVMNFERATYRCNRDAGTGNIAGGTATIWLQRFHRPTASSYTVHYTIDTLPGSFDLAVLNDNTFPAVADADYAVPNEGQAVYDFSLPTVNWSGVSGQITFPAAPNVSAQSIQIPINNNLSQEFDSDIYIELFLDTADAGDASASPTGVIGNIWSTHLTINFDNIGDGVQPGGAVDRTWNVDSVSGSQPPFDALPGASGGTGAEAQAVVIQSDGRAIIGGFFNTYNETNVYNICRLQTTGFLDTSFNTGTGINNGYVTALALDSANRVLVGGSFSSYNSVNTCGNICRLSTTGAFDKTFNTGSGFNGPVNAITTDTNGNIIVVGEFNLFNNTNVNNIVRLLPSGGLDMSFYPNLGNGLPNYGSDQAINAVAIDTNGEIVIGGAFQNVNGAPMNYLARLYTNGTLDTTFNPGVGPDDAVNAIAIATNNEVLIGGDFQNYQLVSRSFIALVNTNGNLDGNFTPGGGFNGPVYSVLYQPDGNALAGGQFTSYNGTRRIGMARILPQGWLDTSFMDTSYNQFAGFINELSSSPANPILAMGLESSGNIMACGSFTSVGGGSTRDAVHPRANVAQIIGLATRGPENGGIGNCPGNITFTENQYNVLDTLAGLYISLERTNGSLGPAALTLGTNLFAPGPGSAGPQDFSLNIDTPEFEDVWDMYKDPGHFPYGWRKSDGFYGDNFATGPVTDNGVSAASIFVNNDPTAAENIIAQLSLLDVNSMGAQNQGLLNLGGVVIPCGPALGIPVSELDILNNNFPIGTLGYQPSSYTTVNTTNLVTLTVSRTNGDSGLISVYYYTADGSARTNAGDYTATHGKLNFFPGTNSQTFTVKIGQFATTQPTKFFNVYFSNAAPNTILNSSILPTNATVTIIDGSFTPGHLSFTTNSYIALKGGIATVGVQRSGGAVGVLQVQCATTNTGTATAGVNYTPVTNTLLWTNGDVGVKTMAIQTLHDSTVEGAKTIGVTLFNATNYGNSASNNLILNSPSNSTVDVLDTDSYGDIAFAQGNFNILMNANTATITVIRTNGTTGTVQVGFATLNNDPKTQLPYQPAVPGRDFTLTNGTLIFGPGVTAQSFVVPILNTGTNETNFANRQVLLQLFAISNSPAANSNSFPLFSTLTILDTNLVLGTAGAVDTTTQDGNGFNNVVYSLSFQPDASILAGGNFNAVNNYPFYNVARLLSSGAYDINFLFDLQGPNSNVFQVLSQPPQQTNLLNGPILIVGEFTQVDGVNRNGIARLNLNGSLDESFNPGSGADGPIYSMAGTLVPTIVGNNVTNITYTQAYYVGGNFANYDGTAVGGIARINAATNSPGLQGTLDGTFNSGAGVTSGNGTVRVLAVQPNNQVVLGGDFTSFNSAADYHLVRLNQDGSVDTSFNPSTGTNYTQSVRAMVVQPDGKILIGGLFTNVNGSGYNYLARLNTDGTVDTNFNVGVGADNAVLALALDSQERILVGGEFSHFSGVTRSGITRLNSDGSVDPTINFGSAADGGFVDTIAVQTNDEIDLGGGFSTFEGLPENNFVRVFGGANYGGGYIQFTSGQYGTEQSATNLTIYLQRFGGEGTPQQTNSSVVIYTTDGTAQAGIDYGGITNTITFPYGETFEAVTIPIYYNSSAIGPNKSFTLNLASPSNAVIGSQIPFATVTITNVNTAVSFSAPTYRQTANAPSGNAVIPVYRLGDTNTVFSITVYTGTNGTATPYTNYIPTTNILTFEPGVTNLYFLVPVLNASNQFSDVTVDLEMDNATNVIPVAPDSATLTIAAIQNGPGYISFSQTNYTVYSPATGTTNALITLLRTNGSAGSVTVVLTTSNITAIAGVQYQAVNITNTFPDGSDSPQIVSIPIYAQPTAGPNTALFLTLTNPTGGAVISGTNQAVLTILNDIENFSFTNSPYFVGEGAGSITVDVVRGGPVTSTAQVTLSTFTPPGVNESQGYALPGIDYTPITQVLQFNPNVTFETLSIPILQTSQLWGPLTFQAVLSNPTNVNSTDTNIQIGVPGSAPITILSDVTGFQFSTNAYSVAESGSNLVVTVVRLNPGTNTASVNFGTSDGTAINQVDYLATNGTLYFSNGMTTNTFLVPVINQNAVENNKTFNVLLSSPQVLTVGNGATTNAYLVAPSNAVVTITNVLTGVSFSAPTYAVSECDAFATIPVILTGSTNNIVSVICSTANGTGVAGVNYTAVTTNFTFYPGQTTTNMLVPIINNHIIGPDHTVNLLMSVTGGALPVAPSAAVLTIQECNGAYIVKAGTSFVSGTLQPGNVPATSGVIFSNETVTIDFGLRDVAGMNTTNLIATLLATNGVTNVSAPQSYGAMAVGGPTVFRPFTFTAIGTNGQNIVANFTLKDGSQVYSNVAFGFTLGGGVTTFSTNEILHLYGSNNVPFNVSKAFNTNPPNNGYPSTINVSGILGTITSVSATVSNFGHTFPENVAMLLVSPTGQASYLMNDCGSDLSVSHLTLTFSQNTATQLPQNTIITNGTYLPSDYGFAIFPSNQLGAPSPPLPSVFKTNLNTFIGNSANGAWELFVADEDTLDSGYVSNGWSISIGVGAAVEQDSDLEMTMSASTANATLSNALTYTINLENYGPSPATNVVITDTLPPGSLYVTNSCGCSVTTNGLLTFNVGNLAVSNSISFTVTVLPEQLGYITNVATATSLESDPVGNNSQTNVLLVSPESADLGVTLTPSGNPIVNASPITYTIVVTNNGPSYATGVSVVDVLPVGFTNSLVATSGATVSTNGSVVTVSWTNLPTMQAGSSSTFTISVIAMLPNATLPSSTNLDTVTVGSAVYDPTKFNNFASVKTEVEPSTMTVMNLGSQVMLTWSAGSKMLLQGATNLPSSPTSPDWVTITNSSLIIQQVLQGQNRNTYKLQPTNTGFHFFRLRSQ